MRLDQLPKEYRLACIHNPRHFYPNSFEVEANGPRLLVVGRVKKHLRKGYRLVAVLKPKRVNTTSWDDWKRPF